MKTFLLILITIPIYLSGAVAWGYTQEDCVGCHQDGSTKSAFHLSVETFESSIHGREELGCRDCHSGVTDASHERSKGSGAVQCLDCHAQENRHGLGSEKGDRPQCHSCHTRHHILEKDNDSSSVHPDRLTDTCRICHPTECGERDALSWLPSLQIASHNKQDFSRAYEETNCIGCHQGAAAHGEEDPLDDQDCYQCHLPREGQGLWGYVHPRADLNQQPGIFGAGILYLVVIAVLLAGGLRFFIKRKSQGDKHC